MDLHLRGKSVLITGASKGIGPQPLKHSPKKAVMCIWPHAAPRRCRHWPSACAPTLVRSHGLPIAHTVDLRRGRARKNGYSRVIDEHAPRRSMHRSP